MGQPRISGEVTCRACGRVGTLVVRQHTDGKVEVLADRIRHADGCSNRQVAPEQPAHLRDRASWRRQERRANALAGARETLASGAVNLDADGRAINKWRVESKQTRGASYILTQHVWSRLVVGALSSGEEPMLHVQLLRNTGNINLCVMRADFLEREVPAGEPLKRAHVHSFDDVLLLDPPAVVITEREFQAIKEQTDVSP